MARPSKRQKCDNWSSEFITLQPKPDSISSSPPKQRVSNSTSSFKEPRKLSTKNSQSRARAAGYLKRPSSQIFAHTRDTKTTDSITQSPEKPKHKSKIEKTKGRDISSFYPISTQRNKPIAFNTASQGTEYSSQNLKANSTSNDDIISDWDEDDLEFSQHSSCVPEVETTKFAYHDQSIKLRNKNLGSSSTEGIRKFHHPKLDESEIHNGSRTWAERFAPVNFQELAVHKRKVADVKKWLEDVFGGKTSQRLLLLKGVSGCGKTTTLRLLAESLGCQVLEWRNPVGPLASSDGCLSMSAQFDEFLGRGGIYGQLDISPVLEAASSVEKKNKMHERKSIILVEEFPSNLSSTSITLQAFQSSILQYLTTQTQKNYFSSNKNSIHSVAPVVIVVSESLLSTSTTMTDSFTAYKLLGKTILQHPGLRTIEFNPIAPTFLTKALELVVQKESRKSGRKKTPGPRVLKQLGEIGDIRSAICSLEFLCLRGDSDGDWSAKVSFSSSKSKIKEAAMTKMEKDSLELITKREFSLGIFHAVGKVIYNKRQDSPSSFSMDWNTEDLPSYISFHSRPKRPVVSVNNLIDEIGTDIQTFIAALHENYVPSCNASPSCFEFSTLDHINGCIDALSDSDLLHPPWSESHTNLGNDSLYSNEISFQIAVRGLLFSLPNPVSRKAQEAMTSSQKGRKDDAYSMFYPASLRLWKIKEDFETTVDLCCNRLLKGTNQNQIGLVALQEEGSGQSVVGTVETWKRNPSNQCQTAAKYGPFGMATSMSRKELILERLPYMAKIIKKRKYSGFPIDIEQLEKVTSFVGTTANKDFLDDYNLTGKVDRNCISNEFFDYKKTKKSSILQQSLGYKDSLPTQHKLDLKLVLSDDDIEDD
ncbi:Checkpoint protein rad17 [Erysiphe necator]|nr:Checkpoint protein rad17 [Erysiphe necator]